MNEAVEYARYTKIFLYYGIETQKRKLQEECAELIRAIARNDEKNMLEEMADVSILIEQFKTVLEYFKKIENIKGQKIKRTLERIEAQAECKRAVNDNNLPRLAIDCLECPDAECRYK